MWEKLLGFHSFRLSLNSKEGYVVVVGFRSFVVVIEIVGRHSDVNAPAVAAAALILWQQLSWILKTSTSILRNMDGRLNWGFTCCLDFYFVFKNELKIMRVEETVILLLFYEGWSCGLLRFYLIVAQRESCNSWLCRTGKSSSNYQTQGPSKVLLMMSITLVEEKW